jgi:RimJ/RimL family protein N-acetyltransferase
MKIKDYKFIDMKEVFYSLSIKERSYITWQEELIDNPQDYLFQKILYINKIPIGFICVFSYDLKSKTTATISIAIKPEYRKRGLAKRLLNYAIKKLLLMGFSRLIYTVDKDNLISQRLAKSMNFSLLKTNKTNHSLVFYCYLRKK